MFAILVHSVFDFVLHITAISVLFLTFVSLIVASGNEFPDDIEEDEPRHRSRKSSSASITSIEKGRTRRSTTK